MMSGENYPIILYGAGDNGKAALKLLNNRGVHPVAFCSRNQARAGEIYCGLPAMSREQVLEKFGRKFKVYITPYPPARKEIENELQDIGFADQSMILNPIWNRDREAYVSCMDLRTEVSISNDSLCVCCGATSQTTPPRHIMIPEYDPQKYSSLLELYRSAVRELIEYKTSLIEDLRAGRPCVCDGCLKLEKACWDDYSGRLENLSIGLSFPCQFACIYCNDVETNAKRENPQRIKESEKMDLATMIQALELEGMEVAYPVSLASGEITIAPKKKEVLDGLSNFPLAILSNAAIYDEQVAALVARNDGSHLNVSVDAGTPETYRYIKGVNAFDRVLSNLRKYKAGGGRVYAKYIILPENCDHDNINGFLDFCADAGIDKILVSRDLRLKLNELSPSIFDAAAYLVEQAKKRNLQYDVFKVFGEYDFEHIQ